MATKTFPYPVIWKGEIVPANVIIEVEEPNAEKEVETANSEKPTRKRVAKNDDRTVK